MSALSVLCLESYCFGHIWKGWLVFFLCSEFVGDFSDFLFRKKICFCIFWSIGWLALISSILGQYFLIINQLLKVELSYLYSMYSELFCYDVVDCFLFLTSPLFLNVFTSIYSAICSSLCGWRGIANGHLNTFLFNHINYHVLWLNFVNFNNSAVHYALHKFYWPSTQEDMSAISSMFGRRGSVNVDTSNKRLLIIESVAARSNHIVNKIFQ